MFCTPHSLSQRISDTSPIWQKHTRISRCKHNSHGVLYQLPVSVKTWHSSPGVKFITHVLGVSLQSQPLASDTFEKYMEFPKLDEKNIPVAVVWWHLDTREVAGLFVLGHALPCWTASLLTIFWLSCLVSCARINVEFFSSFVPFDHPCHFTYWRGWVWIQYTKMSMRSKMFCWGATYKSKLWRLC